MLNVNKIIRRNKLFMRPRHKKNSKIRFEKVESLFAEKDESGRVSELHFTAAGKKALEIGCGKGSFAMKCAEKYGCGVYFAIERISDVLLLAMERAAAEESGNICFLNEDASGLDILFPPAIMDSIYINFCDPWPKKRNAKKRLTSPSFLEKYKKILKSDGNIYFKTDNRALFEYSLITFRECGYRLANICFDLHSSPLENGNIHTEYEDIFSAKGFKINYLEAFLK